MNLESNHVRIPSWPSRKGFMMSSAQNVTRNESEALASRQDANLILGTISPLLIISSFLFLSQIYLRMKSLYHRHHFLGWDECFLILAAVGKSYLMYYFVD
jgi:hypothetical protein